jgi:ribosomal protein S18 acetylase RimI-like enzyme
LKASRKFLAKDPVANVLPLGDLYAPLLNVSEIYLAVKNTEIVGVSSIYCAYSRPSIVFGTTNEDAKQALIESTLEKVSSDFISLLPPDEAKLFKKYATVLHCHNEFQMIMRAPMEVETGDVETSRVGSRELEALNQFYVDHHSEAWTPMQFKTGPYYCVKHEGKIVSAAGVHIVTPQIAHLGNIVTDEAFRGQGFATACTAALAKDLASKGRIISLYVRVDNAPAIHLYEKLGFTKSRDIRFLIMRKKTDG